MEHTKGEWKINHGNIGTGNGKNYKQICCVVNPSYALKGEDLANARLIAAAPDFAQASQDFIDGWLHFCDCIDFGNSALDAEAIRFMNEVPGKIKQALAKAQP